MIIYVDNSSNIYIFKSSTRRTTMTNSITNNTFAAACYDMNSVSDLKAALANGPDATDMKAWNLTSAEWTAQIELAIAAKLDDAA